MNNFHLSFSFFFIFIVVPFELNAFFPEGCCLPFYLNNDIITPLTKEKNEDKKGSNYCYQVQDCSCCDTIHFNLKIIIIITCMQIIYRKRLDYSLNVNFIFWYYTITLYIYGCSKVLHLNMYQSMVSNILVNIRSVYIRTIMSYHNKIIV